MAEHTRITEEQQSDSAVRVEGSPRAQGFGVSGEGAAGGVCRICVGVATYRRPEMLGALLESYLRLRLPAGVEVIFLVVDNDGSGSARGQVEEWSARLGAGGAGARGVYIVEGEPGIPFARNRGLSEAMGMGADYLAYVDDDETVDAGWLEELWGAARSRGLELTGGPVKCVLPAEPVGYVQRAIFWGLESRRRHLVKKAEKRIREGTERKIMIATNNWLLDLGWARRTGLRFDESLRYTGGSDSAFFWSAHRIGIRSGWCDRAVVYETVPAERLTYRYQYGRAVDQAMNAHHRRYPKVRVWNIAKIVVSAGLKLGVGMAALAAAPVTGGRTLLDSARGIGWGVGRLRALCGGRSELYKSVRVP